MSKLPNLPSSVSEELLETCIESQQLYDGAVIRVYKDTVRLPNGKTGVREYNRHNGAVCVLPLTRDGHVLCVRQYRYACGCELLEIPAGKLDSPDEPHEEAARRELREETGAVNAKLTYLGKYLGSPAILNEVIYMYLAEDFSMAETSLDEDEFLRTESIPLSELSAMVLRGEIPDGKTQAAVMRVQAMLAERSKA
ncbi:MAG: NUDIX hydrolase [Clostridia bacterium]|nr:NUDIX hydrolase [Clostridia bacterium]